MNRSTCRHISDWSDINKIRRSPNIYLIKERVKSGAEDIVIDRWRDLDEDSVPALLIEATSICHNNCIYCASPSHDIGESFLLKNLSQIISSLLKRGLLSVWITGGEILHDIERAVEVCKLVVSAGIDIERISTSLVGSNSSVESLVSLVRNVANLNKMFRCTLSISINSYLHAQDGNVDAFNCSFSNLYDSLRHAGVYLHFPIIIDDIYGNVALEYARHFCDRCADTSYSLKSLVPNTNEKWFGETASLKEINMYRYVDCAIPSLFPCAWPMWQLSSQGDLYCCSSWYNDRSSINYLGNIANVRGYINSSSYMREAVNRGGIIPYSNMLKSFCSSDILNMKIPVFDDNTQKCLVCRFLMATARELMSRQKDTI